MLKLKLQYFGHLMQSADLFQKTLMLGKIEGRRRRGQQRMRWIASPTQWTWVWVDSGSWWWTGRPGMLRFMVLQRVRHNWATELYWILYVKCPSYSHFFLLHRHKSKSFWRTLLVHKLRYISLKTALSIIRYTKLQIFNVYSFSLETGYTVKSSLQGNRIIYLLTSFCSMEVKKCWSFFIFLRQIWCPQAFLWISVVRNQRGIEKLLFGIIESKQ